MSDDADTCGYPTAGGDGPPCQNPAGENGRCHIPSHNPDGDDENPGRPSTYTESKARDAIEAARKGLSKAGCGRAAGVPESTLREWLDADHTIDGDPFPRAFMRARHEGEQKLVTGPLTEPEHPDAPEMDGQHARFLLSTSFDYIKTEKQEVEDVTEGGFGGGDAVDEATKEAVRDALADRFNIDR